MYSSARSAHFAQSAQPFMTFLNVATPLNAASPPTTMLLHYMPSALNCAFTLKLFSSQFNICV